MASPIRDRTSKISSAVCISVPSSQRRTIRDLGAFPTDLVSVAADISLVLGYRPKESIPRYPTVFGIQGVIPRTR